MPQDETNGKPKANKKQRCLQLVTVGVMAVLVVAVAWLTYAYMEINQSNAKLQEEITSLKAKITSSSDKPAEPAPSPAPEEAYFKPDDQLVENITAVFNTANTQPLEGHMASQVALYDDSTNVTEKNPVGATLAVADFLQKTDARGWNFQLSADEIAKHKTESGHDKLFGNGCLTGHDQAKTHVASLCFTTEGKIHSIILFSRKS